MYIRYELSAFTVAFIILQKQFSSFLVEGRLGIWVYEQTFDCNENVANAK